MERWPTTTRTVLFCPFLAPCRGHNTMRVTDRLDRFSGREWYPVAESEVQTTIMRSISVLVVWVSSLYSLISFRPSPVQEEEYWHKITGLNIDNTLRNSKQPCLYCPTNRWHKSTQGTAWEKVHVLWAAILFVLCTCPCSRPQCVTFIVTLAVHLLSPQPSIF